MHSMNFTLFFNIISVIQSSGVSNSCHVVLSQFHSSGPSTCGSILTSQHLPNVLPCQSFNDNFSRKWSPGTLDSVDFIVLLPCAAIIVNAYNLYCLLQLSCAVVSPQIYFKFFKDSYFNLCLSHFSFCAKLKDQHIWRRYLLSAETIAIY